jgi:hypothetical protein
MMTGVRKEDKNAGRSQPIFPYWIASITLAQPEVYASSQFPYKTTTIVSKRKTERHLSPSYIPLIYLRQPEDPSRSVTAFFVQWCTYCFFFPAVFLSCSFSSISLISASSFLNAYHWPACSTKTPTSTNAKMVLLAANTLNVSSLLI